MTGPVDEALPLPQKMRREAIEFVKFIAGAAAVYLFITTFVFRTFYIPSSSMEPTLEVGDRVIVLNFWYGFSRWSLPFGLGSPLPEGDGRLLGGAPSRGDIIVFRHPDRSEHLIKRVVGVPGDVVEIRGGRLILNGELAERAPQGQVRYRDYRTEKGDPRGVVEVEAYTESVAGKRPHTIYERTDTAVFDDVGPFTVRPHTVFVMGDNRDASNDSRSPQLAYVPTEHIVGRAVTVLFTLKRCPREEGLACPTGRVWRPL